MRTMCNCCREAVKTSREQVTFVGLSRTRSIFYCSVPGSDSSKSASNTRPTHATRSPSSAWSAARPERNPPPRGLTASPSRVSPSGNGICKVCCASAYREPGYNRWRRILMESLRVTASILSVSDTRLIRRKFSRAARRRRRESAASRSTSSGGVPYRSMSSSSTRST